MIYHKGRIDDTMQTVEELPSSRHRDPCPYPGINFCLSQVGEHGTRAMWVL